MPGHEGNPSRIEHHAARVDARCVDCIDVLRQLGPYQHEVVSVAGYRGSARACPPNQDTLRIQDRPGHADSRAAHSKELVGPYDQVFLAIEGDVDIADALACSADSDRHRIQWHPALADPRGVESLGCAAAPDHQVVRSAKDDPRPGVSRRYWDRIDVRINRRFGTGECFARAGRLCFHEAVRSDSAGHDERGEQQQRGYPGRCALKHCIIPLPAEGETD